MLDHDFRCPSECSIANDRVFRVGVDVEHGRKIQVDPDCAQLPSQYPRSVSRELGVPSIREHPHRRELQDRLSETSYASAFLIDAYEKGKRRGASRMKGLDQGDCLLEVLDVPLEQDQARYPLLRQPALDGRWDVQPFKPADD